MKKAILVGGGEFARDKFVHFVSNNKDCYIVAVDKGYDYIKDLVNVDMVVGDFDSLGYIPSNTQVQTHNPQKNYTDMQLGLDIVVDKGFDNVMVFGALGYRLDHTIANIQLFGATAGQINPILVGINESVCFVNTSLTINGLIGQTISVFSISTSYGVSYEGLKYPLQDFTMTNSFPIGVSNELTDNQATISVQNGLLVVVVNDPN